MAPFSQKRVVKKRFHFLLSSFTTEEKTQLSQWIQELGGTYYESPVSYTSCRHWFAIMGQGVYNERASARFDRIERRLSDNQSSGRVEWWESFLLSQASISAQWNELNAGFDVNCPFTVMTAATLLICVGKRAKPIFRRLTIPHASIDKSAWASDVWKLSAKWTLVVVSSEFWIRYCSWLFPIFQLDLKSEI